MTPRKVFLAFLADRAAASALEYALIVFLVALVCFPVIGLLGLILRTALTTGGSALH